MLLSGLVLVFLAAAGIVNGALSPLAPGSYEVFITNFRQALLDKVAVEVNSTVEESENLKTAVDLCKPKISTKVDQCKACAKDKCQASLSFKDVVNIVNPYTYLKKPLDNIAGKIGNAVDLLKDKAGGFLNSMSSLGSSFKIPNEFKYVYDQIKVGVEKAIKSLKSLGKDIAGLTIKAGDFFKDNFDKLKDALGKKRRRRAALDSIDPKVKKCMQKCSSCKPLLLPTEDELITAVCGPEIVKQNNSIQYQLKKIQAVYDYLLDKTNPIVKKLEVDPQSANSKFELTNVRITVFLNGKYISYAPKAVVPMLDIVGAPAKAMAMEYWAKFKV